MTIQIVSSALPNGAVSCVVIELIFNQQTGQWDELRRSSSTGTYIVSNQAATTLRIFPRDGHWSTRVDIASLTGTLLCERIQDDVELPWWQRAVGVSSPRTHSARNVRIGVIDCIFEHPPSLAHVNFIDDPAHISQLMQMLGAARQRTHGQLVTHVVAARGPDQFAGIASDAEVFFADATLVRNGRLYPSMIEPELVLEAIERLAEHFGVDLINISCGFTEDGFPTPASFVEFTDDLVAAVELAADYGCLCVCSGGNSSTLPPPLPAKLDQTVGVGGIGMCDIAPSVALTSIEQRRATIGTRVPGIGQFFHDPDASVGPGIDVAAPSIGVVLKPLQNVVIDYRGTSVAAPLACGVLACHLNSDPIYQGLSGRSRFDRAWALMLQATYPLGLNPSQVGDGLPHLP